LAKLTRTEVSLICCRPECGEGLRQPVEVSRKPTKAPQLADTALHSEEPPQQRKSVLRFRQLDHLKCDSVLKRCMRGFLAGLALIGKYHPNRPDRGLLDLTRQ
jgi:hypothetical protein